MARRILTDGGPVGERWEPSLIPDTVQGSASSLRTTEQCSRQADTHRKCVMKRPMNISVGNMLVNLKLSSVILLLNVVSTISSLSLTAIEVPKYAKVNVRCQLSDVSVQSVTCHQVGERLRLVCNFTLGEDQLYSVKWYKDNMEFYR